MLAQRVISKTSTWWHISVNSDVSRLPLVFGLKSVHYSAPTCPPYSPEASRSHSCQLQAYKASSGWLPSHLMARLSLRVRIILGSRPSTLRFPAPTALHNLELPATQAARQQILLSLRPPPFPRRLMNQRVTVWSRISAADSRLRQTTIRLLSVSSLTPHAALLVSKAQPALILAVTAKQGRTVVFLDVTQVCIYLFCILIATNCAFQSYKTFIHHE
jgi:hypothetical protein